MRQKTKTDRGPVCLFTCLTIHISAQGECSGRCLCGMEEAWRCFTIAGISYCKCATVRTQRWIVITTWHNPDASQGGDMRSCWPAGKLQRALLMAHRQLRNQAFCRFCHTSCRLQGSRVGLSVTYHLAFYHKSSNCLYTDFPSNIHHGDLTLCVNLWLILTLVSPCRHQWLDPQVGNAGGNRNEGTSRVGVNVKKAN